MSETTGTRRSRPGFLRAVTRRFGTWPLFGVILVWVVLALVVFTVLGWLWGEGPLWSWQRWLTNWRGASAGASPLDVVKVSLTTIGGIGGTGYLVIKYRERASAERAERDAEQNRAEQRLLSGVQQLGSGSPQVRIAGVYALADVADIYKGAYRQRIVDILCGYLRTQRGTWKVVTDNQNADDSPARKRDYVSSDGAVESTILNVLSRHLRKRRKALEPSQAVRQDVEDDQLWCDCTLDLHGAVINEPINFSGATFSADVRAQGARILADADFLNANFSSKVDFNGSEFRGYADFRRARFGDFAEFQQTCFASKADFQDSIFEKKCNFNKASIGQAAFNRAKFQGAACFKWTQFEKIADYTQSEFTTSEFKGSKFLNGAKFWYAQFRQHADFKGARFLGDIETNFDSAIIQSATFENASFELTPTFENARFNEELNKRSDFSFPSSITVEEDTGLPSGARWARFDGHGHVIAVPPTRQRTGTNTPGGENGAVS